MIDSLVKMQKIQETFFFLNPTTESNEYRTDFRVFHFRFTYMTLSMFYLYEINKETRLFDVISVVASQTRNSQVVS